MAVPGGHRECLLAACCASAYSVPLVVLLWRFITRTELLAQKPFKRVQLSPFRRQLLGAAAEIR